MASYALSAFRGDSKTINFIFYESDEKTRRDITGWTLFFTIKVKEDDVATDTGENCVYKKTITNHSNPTQGETGFTMTPEETDSLNGFYIYDCQFKDNNGKIKTFVKDTFEFHKDVTRRTS